MKACTDLEFERLLRGDGTPDRFGKTILGSLDCELDDLTAEYLHRRVVEFFDGMKIPEKRRLHVIRAILSCAEYQGLVWKEKTEDGPFFYSTERLAISWGALFAENPPYLSSERLRSEMLVADE
ncbi:MAG: hypothetical protein AB7I42_17650 [Bradyrhizobium sp.]|uniref:hypothetical protein n=1 Tax=Bradyrhizobium sp. TaxID=376 RepID=UPI003D12B200